MNCDFCKRQLTEDNTYEHILCKRCMDDNMSLHCPRCKVVVNAKGFGINALKFVSSLFEICFDKYFYVSFPVLILVILGIMLNILADTRGSKIVASFSFGCLAIAVGIPVIILVGWLLFPFTYQIGCKVNKSMGLGFRDIETSPMRWLIGLCTYLFPVMAYFVGSIIYNHIFHK